MRTSTPYSQGPSKFVVLPGTSQWKGPGSEFLTSLSSLDSCVNEALTTPHGMEKEFGGCESSQVGILYKATTLGSIVILNEMRQSPMLESKWDPLALHILLPNDGNDLGNRKGRVHLTPFALRI